jgi:hypothetical protein
VNKINLVLVEIVADGVDWIGLYQGRDKWRALVNAVIIFEFHKMLGNYGVATQLMASRVVFSFIELFLVLITTVAK